MSNFLYIKILPRVFCKDGSTRIFYFCKKYFSNCSFQAKLFDEKYFYL